MKKELFVCMEGGDLRALEHLALLTGRPVEEVAAGCLESGLERMITEATDRPCGSAKVVSFCRPADRSLKR